MKKELLDEKLRTLVVALPEQSELFKDIHAAVNDVVEETKNSIDPMTQIRVAMNNGLAYYCYIKGKNKPVYFKFEVTPVDVNTLSEDQLKYVKTYSQP